MGPGVDIYPSDFKRPIRPVWVAKHLEGSSGVTECILGHVDTRDHVDENSQLFDVHFTYELQRGNSLCSKWLWHGYQERRYTPRPWYYFRDEVPSFSKRLTFLKSSDRPSRYTPSKLGEYSWKNQGSGKSLMTDIGLAQASGAPVHPQTIILFSRRGYQLLKTCYIFKIQWYAPSKLGTSIWNKHGSEISLLFGNGLAEVSGTAAGTQTIIFSQTQGSRLEKYSKNFKIQWYAFEIQLITVEQITSGTEIWRSLQTALARYQDCR